MSSVFPLFVGGTAGATSDLRMACDRARVLLHAEERLGSSVASKVGGDPLSPLWLWCSLAVVCPAGTLPLPHPSDHAASVLLKSKKNVIVADTPSVVFHYSETNLDETVSSRKTDAIFRAAKKDLLTLMKLDVSGHPPALSLAWVSMETCAVSGGTGG